MKHLPGLRSPHGFVISAIAEFGGGIDVPAAWTASAVDFNHEAFYNSVDGDRCPRVYDAGDYFVHIGEDVVFLNVNPQFRVDGTWARTFEAIFGEFCETFWHALTYRKLRHIVYKIADADVTSILARHARPGIARDCMRSDGAVTWWYADERHGGYAVERKVSGGDAFGRLIGNIKSNLFSRGESASGARTLGPEQKLDQKTIAAPGFQRGLPLLEKRMTPMEGVSKGDCPFSKSV